MKITKFAKRVLTELIEVAKENETVTYGELAERLGQPGKTLCIPKVLGHVTEYTYEEMGIFISALVVNKESGMPGRGFTQLASNLMQLTHVIDDEFVQKHTKTLFNMDHKSLDRLRLVATR